MKRKGYTYLIICILLVYILTACSGTSMENQGNDVQKGNVEDTSQNSSHYRPLNTPEFESMTEVKAFLGQVGTINQDTSKADNVDVSGIATTLLFPVFRQPSETVQFGSTWFSENNSLDLRYGIDGIQYRVTYFFGSDYVWENEEEPSVRGMKLGAYTVDFWAQEHVYFDVQFYGYVKTDDVYISITVTGNEIDSPNFEAFEFVPLSSIGGNAVE